MGGIVASRNAMNSLVHLVTNVMQNSPACGRRGWVMTRGVVGVLITAADDEVGGGGKNQVVVREGGGLGVAQSVRTH